jgi:hypothetical protein
VGVPLKKSIEAKQSGIINSGQAQSNSRPITAAKSGAREQIQLSNLSYQNI